MSPYVLIDGVAAPYNCAAVLEAFSDPVALAPGCFSADQHSCREIPVHVNHGRYPIGAATALGDDLDASGLQFCGEVNNASWVQLLPELFSGGTIYGTSIAWHTNRSELVNGVRVIREATLKELSVCLNGGVDNDLYPMFPGTSVRLGRLIQPRPAATAEQLRKLEQLIAINNVLLGRGSHVQPLLGIGAGMSIRA